MTTTLKDYLRAINIIGEDHDVYVDGIDAIAVCPPVKFTPKGLEHFKKALDAKVEVEYKDGSHCGTYVGDDDEQINEQVWTLLSSLAGYCAGSKFEIWFEGDSAEII